MTEPERTGYRESPDTTDGPVTPGSEQVAGDDGDATLTTDTEAQREDPVMRPGNQSD
jgi:hypothetical protein